MEIPNNQKEMLEIKIIMTEEKNAFDGPVSGLNTAKKCISESKNVSIETIVNAVKNGSDTVEKVGEATGAGTACGRCKGIILNIIENKR